MAKDMYQKRKERQENKQNKTNEDNKTNINWFPGHMAKTRREIKESINLVDIVYEVIDGRIPISSRIDDINELISNKPRIIIVSKYDLCDKEKTDKILETYRNAHVLKLDLKNGNSFKQVINLTNESLKDINVKRMEKGLKPRLYRAMVIGVPNVGKSTLINKLVGKIVVKTGNTPGVTRNLSWIRAGKTIELLDTPGILWPKINDEVQGLNLATFTSIKEEVLNLDDICKYIIETLYMKYPKILEDRYGIKNDKDVSDFYNIIGNANGALLKNNTIDQRKVQSIIMSDLKDGLLGNITFD